MTTAQISREKQQQKLAPPKKFGVFLLNDDYTPMDFVVELLIDVFAMNEQKAEQIMLMIHHQGKGLCGVYSKDIAYTKLQQVQAIVSSTEYPLLAIVEEMQ